MSEASLLVWIPSLLFKPHLITKTKQYFRTKVLLNCFHMEQNTTKNKQLGKIIRLGVIIAL